MAERFIEVGKLRIHLTEDEDAVTLLQSLMRHVSNQKIATSIAELKEEKAIAAELGLLKA